LGSQDNALRCGLCLENDAHYKSTYVRRLDPKSLLVFGGVVVH
jgi:hypothetical protein